MTNNLVESIHIAMSQSSDSESVMRTKDVVINFFQEADPSSSITKSDYFNHSYIPDFTVSWKGNSVSKEKQVFLRPYSQIDYLSQDVESIGNVGSCLFSLDNLPSDKSPLDLTTRQKNSMVVDPSALDSLIDQKRNGSISSILNSATLRSGMGAISAIEIKNTAKALDEAFDSARGLKPEGILESQGTIHHLLNEDAAAEIDSYLLALWLASDGELHNFPNSHPYGNSNISDDALLNLLELSPFGDRNFWKGISKAIDFRQLTKLKPNFTSTNLQYLLEASIELISTNSMGIMTNTIPFESSGTPVWKIDNERLKFEGDVLIAYFSDSSEELAQIIGNQESSTTLQDLIDRVEDHKVSEVVLSGTGEVLSIKGLGEDSATNTDTFRRHLEANSKKFVDSVKLTLNSGIKASVDYEKMLVTTGTKSKLTLRQHLSESVGLLTSVPANFIEYLNNLDLNPKQIESHETLF